MLVYSDASGSVQIAEQWVNNMTISVEDESTEVVLEARPPRSASLLHHGYVYVNVTDKRKVAKSAEEDEILDEDRADEETESRTKAFSKKRAANLTSYLPAKKKRK
ncbi:hypothetical protein RJ640_002311 [Escallonia rubra]|uniref:Uncharacterized protein n=1 Tax=Escallonia rubra TaxID=112253 RepID=A0AA88QZL3_9ASTE|nr:hypothetical protein RJ640_002311 [Escallonia rubra]